MYRLREPSTWAGIAALAQAVKAFLPPQWQWVSDAITAGCGSAAIGLREQPKV